MDEFDLFIKRFAPDAREPPEAGLARVFGLDARRACDFVASLPRVVKRRVREADRARYTEALEALGAELEWRRSPIVPQTIVTLGGGSTQSTRAEAEGGATLMLQLPGAEEPAAAVRAPPVVAPPVVASPVVAPPVVAPVLGEATRAEARPPSALPAAPPGDTRVDPALGERIAEAQERLHAAAPRGDPSRTAPSYGWGGVAARASSSASAATVQGLSHHDDVSVRPWAEPEDGPDVVSVPPATLREAPPSSALVSAPPPAEAPDAPAPARAAWGDLAVQPEGWGDVDAGRGAPASRDPRERHEPSDLRAAASASGPRAAAGVRLSPAWQPLGEGSERPPPRGDLPPPSEVPQLGLGARPDWLVDDATSKADAFGRTPQSESTLELVSDPAPPPVGGALSAAPPAVRAGAQRIARAAVLDPPAPLERVPTPSEPPVVNKLVLRGGIGLALFVAVLAIKHCGSPVDRALGGAGSAPESPNQRQPALVWRGRGNALFRGFDQEVTLRLIERFKQAGAVEVYVYEVRSKGSAAEAQSLEVELPDDPAKRKAVLQVDARYGGLERPRQLAPDQHSLIVPLH